jgi:hypothetical protein
VAEFFGGLRDVVHDLVVGEAADLVAAEIEVDVAAAVVLEGALRPVGAEAVGLDDETLLASQEVGLVAAQRSIGLGVRESGGA